MVLMGIAGISIAAALMLLLARLASVDRRLDRLSRLDAKLDALLQHAGVRFDQFANIPPDVIGALQRGETVEAIKRFRAATGLGLKEAKDYLDEVKRRG